MLEGDLTDFSIPDVLRLLAFTSKTGRLTVAFDARHGRVDLVDGRVRDASAEADRLQLARRVLGSGVVEGSALLEVLDGFDQLPTDLELARALVTAGAAEPGILAELVRAQTVDAVADLLRWPEGRFQFTTSDPADRGPTVLDLAVAVDELLDETTRRLEAWAALEARERALGGAEPQRVPAPDTAPGAAAPAAPDATAGAAAPAAPVDVGPAVTVAGPDADLVEVATQATAARPLRATVRTDRMRTDPTVDEDLVSRLIAGVEAL
ncbi:MAG: DUF4388 domain-containing protein [Nitriliruptor sp.]